MRRPGRHVGRAVLAAFCVLAVVACHSAATVIQCGACPGDYVDPNGLIGPQDQVASIRVCIDSVCRTMQYHDVDRRHGGYANIIGSSPPNRARIESIEITTFDAQHRVVRVETGSSIDLPTVKRTGKNSCACSGFKIAYDNTGGRFVVTTQ
jgi:hypothetical protein